jgi:hypothetical protein
MTRVLLVDMDPWLVALPIAAVGRVVAVEDGVLAPADGGAIGGLGTVTIAGAGCRAWDLGRLLHGADGAVSWIILAGQPAALRAGRCLRVIDGAAPVAAPALVGGGRHGIGLLSTAGLAGATVPFALWLDPGPLLAAPSPALLVGATP